MPTIYDLTYSTLGQQLLPPDKRNTRLIAFVTSLLAPMQWLRDLWMGSYRTGDGSTQYNSSTSYPQYQRVQYGKQVWESTQAGNMGNTPGTGSAWWLLVQANFIGLTERLVYNGQILVLTWALNKWFNTPANPCAFVPPAWVSITQVARASNTATITAPNHMYNTGQWVNIFGLANGVATASITSTGSGLNLGTYASIGAITLSGNGNGAVFTVTVTGGVITAVTKTSAGTGYQVGDTLTFPVGFDDGSSTATGVITIATVTDVEDFNGTWQITKVDASTFTYANTTGIVTTAITNAGSGLNNGTYGNVAAVTLSGSGAGAAFSVTVAGHIITAVALLEAGGGYVASDTFTFPVGFDGGSSTATGVITVSTVASAGGNVSPTAANGYAVALSNIFIETNTIPTSVFVCGGTEAASSLVYTNVSSAFVINSYSFATPYNFTIYVPSAAYTALASTLANRQAIFNAFAAKYIAAGMQWNISPY